VRRVSAPKAKMGAKENGAVPPPGATPLLNNKTGSCRPLKIGRPILEKAEIGRALPPPKVSFRMHRPIPYRPLKDEIKESSKKYTSSKK
jgi:hypothetical protein